MAKHDLAKGRATELLHATGLTPLPDATNKFRDLRSGRFAGPAQAVERLERLPDNNVAREIISQLEAGRTKKEVFDTKKLSYKGKIFSIDFTQGAANVMNRAANTLEKIHLLQTRRSFILDNFRSDLTSVLPFIAGLVKAKVREVMSEEVYDRPVEIIYYKKAGKPSAEKYPEYVRTNHLMLAVTEGVKIVGQTIQFDIDDSLAPYWLWVDRGYRLFMPDGRGGSRETGMYIVGRSYIARIGEVIDEFMGGEMQALLAGRYKGAIRELGQWALESEEVPEKNDLFIEHWPTYGYGQRFQNVVGLNR